MFNISERPCKGKQNVQSSTQKTGLFQIFFDIRSGINSRFPFFVPHVSSRIAFLIKDDRLLIFEKKTSKKRLWLPTSRRDFFDDFKNPIPTGIIILQMDVPTIGSEFFIRRRTPCYSSIRILVVFPFPEFKSGFVVIIVFRHLPNHPVIFICNPGVGVTIPFEKYLLISF